MSPFAAVAVKTLGAAGAAALLSMSAAQAASPTPSHDPKAGAAIRHAVIESEADVLGITPEKLVDDLRSGQKVSDLAKDKGMTKEQFETKLVANLRPRLEALVDKKVITQAQADKTIERISNGYVPFWNGLHRHHKK